MFCDIAAGREWACVVEAGELTLTFLDRRQFQPGHQLVIPRPHERDVREADDETCAEVAAAVGRAARAVDRVFPGDGLSVWHSAGAGANQEVPHMHFHVHPRRLEDDLLRVYPSPPAEPAREALEGWAARLRAGLHT